MRRVPGILIPTMRGVPDIGEIPAMGGILTIEGILVTGSTLMIRDRMI
jgi:hypothetical protein